MIYNVAVDGGNSTIKCVVNGEKIKPVIPSITVKTEAIDYSEIKRNYTKDMQGQGYDKLDVTVMLHRDKGKYPAESFLLGHAAEKYRDSARTRHDIEKCTDTELASWMLTTAAYSIYQQRKNAGEKIGKHMKVEVNFATGLPYRECIDETKWEKFTNMFKGSHLIKFNHPYFNGLQVEMTIQNVFVYAEGESSLDNILHNQDSEYMTLPPVELLDTIVAIIDSGGYTSEIFSIEFVEEPSDEYSQSEEDLQLKVETNINLTLGIPKGIGHAMLNTVNDVLKYEGDKLRRKKLSKREIEKALLRTYKGKPGYIFPEKIYIKDYFDKHATNYAYDLAREFQGVFEGHETRLRKIYFTGGGSKIDTVVEKFKETLSETFFNVDDIVCLPDPIYSNVMGYYTAMLDDLGMEIEADSAEVESRVV